jgi:F420-dependent oxidoreductase-like protein
MRISLMVEGQEGVTWKQWLALARACEEAGLEGLFRSDHYLSFSAPRERGVLDAWTTLAGLAAVTERIQLGTLVSPATFRHPSNLAKSVITVDHISGGRAELGLGAGWFEGEHKAYGFPFPDLKTRMEVFAEQAEIIHRSWNHGEFSFQGKHYEVEGLDAVPKPAHTPHPNFIVGGRGGPKSLAVAARWADEYNVHYLTPSEVRDVRDRAVAAWEKRGRDKPPVFSVMTGCVAGRDEAELRKRASKEQLDAMPPGFIRGTRDEVAEQINALAEVGVDRVMMQMQDHSDVDLVHVLGEIAADPS